MPNHIHGIIVIVDPSDNKTVVATHASPLEDDNNRPKGPYPGSLGGIIGSFKSAVTRRVNQIQDSIGSSFWQRGYYERIVRNERELIAIRNNIRKNPQRWEEDRDNLDALIYRMK